MAESTRTEPRPFVGRGRELETLTALATDTRIGRGSLVVLSGPPGVGRTRLAEQLTGDASAQGLRPLWSRSWPSDGAAALAPWATIVRRAIGDTDITAMTTDLEQVAAVQALGLVSDMVPHALRPRGIVPPDRLALFDGTTRLLARLAHTQPLLIVLDDLDAAGAASLRFLEFLAPQVAAIPMTVVAIWSGPGPESLAGQAHRLDLAGLGADEAAALLQTTTGRRADDATAAAVHGVTGGSPLLIAELGRRLARTPGSDVLGAGAGTAPEAILTDSLARMNALSRQIVAVAAVLGQEFDVELVASVQGTDVATVRQALETAEQAGVVTPAGADTGPWAFTHALWRQAAVAGAKPTERAALHRRVARALEHAYGAAAPAHAGQLAGHHLASAEAMDRPAAVRWAEQAGDNAMAEMAWEDAVRHYAQALDVVVTDDDRARLLVARGGALLSAGDIDNAVSMYEDAAALARGRGNPVDLARAALGLSATLTGFEPLPPHPAALPLLEEVLGAADPADPVLAVHVAARLSMALGSGTRQRRQELSNDAVARARALGGGAGESALVAALVSRCHAFADITHRHRRLDDADEIVALAQRSGDLEMQLVGRRLRVVALLEDRNVAAVDAEIAAFAATAGHLGQPRLCWIVDLWRGMRALVQGRFTECERRTAEAAGMGRRAGLSRADALATVQSFALRVAQDRVVELEALARALAARPGDRADSGATLACLLGLLGRDGQAGTELARLAEGHFGAVADHDDRWLAALVVLAELAATLDRRPECEILYELLAPHARCFAVEAMGTACHGSVSRHLGLLAHALGRWDEADAWFGQALEDNTAAGAPLLVAHTRSQWSALRRARDVGTDWEQGLELLIGAEVIYRRLGVDRLADEARQVLARSHEPAANERDGAGNVLRHQGERWSLSYGGVEAWVTDSLGMHDLATFVGNPDRSFHVADLVAGTVAGHSPRPDSDALARAEYRARLVELDGIDATGDPVRASLARAERDFIEGELVREAETAGDDLAVDPVERARRTVAARIRLSLDRIDDAHPALGRHLRHSVRTGTFCSYEPEIPTNWSLPGTGPGSG